MDPESFEYMYVRIANAVERDIRSGRLPYGARLPNERDLGEQYGVAPGTVRRAMRELRERGIVLTKASKGTFVIARDARE